MAHIYGSKTLPSLDPRLPPVALLIGVSALGPVVMNGVLPANSALMAEFKTHYSVVQLVLTIFLVALLIGQIVLGHAADRFGRRPVMIFSLLVFAVGGFMGAMAPSIEWLLLSRFVQGLGASACSFLPRTVVRDIYDRERSASVIGYMTTAMMVAPMFGPALGGWVTDHASWRLMYAGLGVAGLLLSGLSWLFLHETQAQVDKRTHSVSFLRVAGALFREREFVAYSMMLAGSVGVYYSFLTGAPFVVIESRGLSAAAYGGWFASVAVGYLSGNLAAGRFSQHVGVRGMIRIGLLPGSLGLLLFWLFSGWQHPLGLFLPMLCVAFSNGMSLPNLFSAVMSVRPEFSASASGLSGSIQIAFGVLLSLLLGALLPAGDNWLYIVMSASALVCASGFWLLNAARH